MRSSRKTALVGAVSLLGTAAVLMIAVPASAEKGAMMEHHMAQMIEHHKAHMAKVDTDGDGKVSKTEAEAARKEHFKSADMDGNGSVSFDEFEAMAERRRQMKLKSKFERSDKNGDGVLTSEELGSHRDGHFEKMDKNGDGEISEDERKAAHKRGGKHRRHWFKGHGDADHGPDEG